MKEIVIIKINNYNTVIITLFVSMRNSISHKILLRIKYNTI